MGQKLRICENFGIPLFFSPRTERNGASSFLKKFFVEMMRVCMKNLKDVHPQGNPTFSLNDPSLREIAQKRGIDLGTTVTMSG